MDNDNGCPHALEHFIFMGSKSHNKGFLDAYAANRFCTEINASTKSDHTIYHFSGFQTKHHGVEDVIIFGLMEHLLHPALPEDAFQSEIFDIHTNSGVIYNELKDRQYDSKIISILETKKILHKNPGSHNCLASGSAKTIKDLKFTDIQKYHEDFYKLNHMALICKGTLDMEYLFKMMDPFLKCSISPKRVFERDVIVQDTLKEMQIPGSEDLLILSCGFQIPILDFQSTKVLLEFFKKSDVLFSKFSYELCKLDEDFAQVLVIFDDFEELDEGKMAKKMKQSISQYMNQVNPELFLECIKNGLESSKTKVGLEQELTSIIKDDIIDHFLYKTEVLDDPYASLQTKEFKFWLQLSQKWISAPWAVFVGTGSKRLMEDTEHKVQSKIKLNQDSSEDNLINFRTEYPIVENSDFRKFSLIMARITLNSFTKEDSDHLPIIEALIAKSIRKTCQVLKIKTYHCRQKFLFLFIFLEHQHVQEALKVISDRTFMENLTDNIEKVAKAIYENFEDFDVQDLSFWRTFLRFKYVLKSLKSVRSETKHIEKLVKQGYWMMVVAEYDDQVGPKLQTTNELGEERTKVKSYGYGHHRINVSENVQSSQACIMMNVPDKMSMIQVLLICEILNKFVFCKIREQGLAYAVNVQVDFKAEEIVILLHDSTLVLNALSAIRDAVQELPQFKLSDKMLERIKRSAYFKHCQRLQNPYDKLINEFIDACFNRTFELSELDSITPVTVSELLRQFSDLYLNNSNLNIVIMMPKSTAMQKMSTLKAFVTYGFKLFM